MTVRSPAGALLATAIVVAALLAAWPASAQTAIDHCVGHDHPPFAADYPPGGASYVLMALATDLPPGTEIVVGLFGNGVDSEQVVVVQSDGTAEIAVPIFQFGAYDYRAGPARGVQLIEGTHDVGPDDVVCTASQLFTAPAATETVAATEIVTATETVISTPATEPTAVVSTASSAAPLLGVSGSRDDGLSAWLIAPGVLMLAGGTVLVVRRRDGGRGATATSAAVAAAPPAGSAADAGDAFMEAFVRAFGEDPSTTAGLARDVSDRDWLATTRREERAQNDIERELRQLLDGDRTHPGVVTGFEDLLAAADAYQSAFVHALSGSTSMQGLMQEWSEVQQIAQKQDLALAVTQLLVGEVTAGYKLSACLNAPTKLRTGGRLLAGSAGATATRSVSSVTATATQTGTRAAGATVPAWRVAADAARWRIASAVQRLPGIHDVAIHGHPIGGFTAHTASGGWRAVTVDTVAGIVARGQWTPGMPIRLFSCHAATSGSAAALARRLQVIVVAPTREVWVDDLGRIAHLMQTPGGQLATNPTGYWVVFDTTGKAISRFVGGRWVPIR